MDIDLKTGTITFRVLYHGPRGATKFLNVRGLQPVLRSGDLAIMHSDAGRVLVHQGATEDGVVPGFQVHFHALAVPGEAVGTALPRLLLLAADALVLLPDRAGPGTRESILFQKELSAQFRELGPELTDLVILRQVYRDDGDAGRQWRGHPLIEQAPEVVVPGDTPAAIAQVFGEARRRILERVQQAMSEAKTRSPTEVLVERAVARQRKLEVHGKRRPLGARWEWALVAAGALIGAAYVLCCRLP